jgi:hypothetical protein
VLSCGIEPHRPALGVPALSISESRIVTQDRLKTGVGEAAVPVAQRLG